MYETKANVLLSDEKLDGDGVLEENNNKAQFGGVRCWLCNTPFSPLHQIMPSRLQQQSNATRDKEPQPNVSD